MASEAELLRNFELRLLRCTLPSEDSNPPPPPAFPLPSHRSYHPLYASIDDTVRSIEAGHYVEALSSHSARSAFKFTDALEPYRDDANFADQFYCGLHQNAICFMIDDADDEVDIARRAVLLLSIAVAAFLAFTQCNLTGPKVRLPLIPLGFVDEKAQAACGMVWEVWARNELLSFGSDLLGKLSNLQYIVFAKMLLMRIKDVLFEKCLSSLNGIRSLPWWLARTMLLQQRILDERSSSLFDLLQVFFNESLQHFGSLENVISYWGAKSCEEEAKTVVSMLHVEAGIMEHTYGRVDPCRRHFESAELAAGLQLSVVGALGFRTVHQTEAKAQLVLVANKSTSKDGNTCLTIPIEQQRNASSINVDGMGSSQHEKIEASDILVTPKLLENDNKSSETRGSGSQDGDISIKPLKAIQQAVILAQCLVIERSTRHDEMQRWEMAPYIEAIDSQKSSYFMIQRFCDILRIRCESSRSRTKERALLMMEKLAQNIYEPLPGVAQRIFFCYGVHVPTTAALRREYGELLVSSGLIGEAVKIFEELELWDNLIFCYSLLEKKGAAIELIKKRLCEMPSDPRLWCCLGDVTNNDSYYEKALEVSDDRFARAKRSLARSAYNRGDFAKSKVLWESAMALNSMYPDGWFALGAAALKARDFDKALDGFTRAVQLDPESGEAWNNIAYLHMRKGRSKEAFIAFKEALKFKRDSWQLWENYSLVAADIGNFGQAMEAIQKVLDMTGNKRVGATLLDRLMQEMEGRAMNRSSTSVTSHSTEYSNKTSSGSFLSSAHELSSMEMESFSGETKFLMELLGKILQRIVRSGCEANLWGLYARWHKIQGDLSMCSEALLKQVRSYQGSDLWKDRDRFQKFVIASIELCGVYMEIASSTRSRRELIAAEMHLNNSIKQAASFQGTQELRDLQACFDEVKCRLQST